MASWHALAVLLDRPHVGAASKALLALGATGIQEDVPPGVTVKFRQPWDKGPGPRPPRRVLLRAWFGARPDDHLVAAALAGMARGEPEWQVQAEEDWENGWKEHFQPVRISDRLVVAAPWHNVEGAVLIEPGNAFGTGEHVTTRACLRAIDRYAVPGGRLLDVGCGSGILALAGAKLGMDAWGIDNDPESVRAAQEAARINALPARFDATPMETVEGRFELVVANLFAEVLAELAPHLLRVSAGPISLAGILTERAPVVRAAFASRAVLEEAEEAGWTSLVYAGP